VKHTLERRNSKHLQGVFSLALAFSLLLGALPLCAMAQVGPMPPEAPPSDRPPGEEGPLNQVKNSLMKLFKKDEDINAQQGEKPKSGPRANPYGTTVPDISDPASSRTPQRYRQNAQREKEKEAQQAPQVTAPARPPMISAPPLTNAKIEKPTISEDNPPIKLVTLDDPTNPLGFTDALNRLNNISTLIENEDFHQAKILLTPLRQWLVDSTEAHIGLYKALSNVSSAKAQAELEKQLALQFALLRDKAMFQMGVLQVQQKNYKAAIKDLTEVIKSQPRSEMGLKAYSLLQEIGFTEKLQIAD